MMPQITATMSADQPRPVAEPMAHHNATDSEQQHEVPGDGGAAEHAGALPGAGRGLLHFGLGQFQFLPHQGGQVRGDLGDQLTQRPVTGRAARAGGPVSAGVLMASRHLAGRPAPPVAPRPSSGGGGLPAAAAHSGRVGSVARAGR